MINYLQRLILLLSLLWSTGLIAADTIEIIQLKNRTAKELIPILKPMLAANGAISGNGFQLILRTTPTNLQQLQTLIARLDKAPAQLMISVFQGTERDLQGVSRQLAFRYERKLTISGSVQSTQKHMSDYPVYQLRIMEGSSGYIQTGQTVPQTNSRVFQSRGRTIVDSQLEYRDINSGFYVEPRLNKQQVTLNINPYKASLSQTRGGIIDTQSASTTVTGPLGQWLQIGGLANEKRTSGHSIGRHYQTRERQQNQLWIRADPIN